jgi:hypothetical protein
MMFLPAYAEDVAQKQPVEADACDDRQSGDDKETSLNRAIDKASLSAVKLSGIIQKQNDKIYASVLDVISYHIIDNYLFDVEREVTYDDAKRVCVKVKGNVAIPTDELNSLIEEYKSSMTPESLAEITEDVKQNVAFKPNKLSERKLVYINNMRFWDGSETDHYEGEIKKLFDDNEYFFITDKKDTADFVITPVLEKAQVDKIDDSNHKMQMILNMEIVSDKINGFNKAEDVQNHFILFSADKDEQEIADDLIKKLLKKSAYGTSNKIEEAIQNHLKQQEVKK